LANQIRFCDATILYSYVFAGTTIFNAVIENATITANSFSEDGLLLAELDPQQRANRTLYIQASRIVLASCSSLGLLAGIGEVRQRGWRLPPQRRVCRAGQRETITPVYTLHGFNVSRLGACCLQGLVGPSVYVPSLIRVSERVNASVVFVNTTFTCFAAACQPSPANSTLPGGSTLTAIATADKLLSALLELQHQSGYSSTWCRGILPPPATFMLTANISIKDVGVAGAMLPTQTTFAQGHHISWCRLLLYFICIHISRAHCNLY
jgi:hypothetical protein